jgi:phosphopantothenoylcysteine synthetase/decarboxylase
MNTPVIKNEASMMKPGGGAAPLETGDTNLSGYEIVVAVCGGIAAFKTASLVSALVQRGAGVSVAMTAAAQKFITALTFESLTARKVHTNLWDSGDSHDPQHLTLTESADLMIIAPATANMIAKIAHALADDLVSTMVLSAAGPVILAPAMNTRMWQNPLVQQNVRALVEHGFHLVQPDAGWLACRTIGEGRMAAPEVILDQSCTILKHRPAKRHNVTK